jgi:hypothetical protein
MLLEAKDVNESWRKEYDWFGLQFSQLPSYSSRSAFFLPTQRKGKTLERDEKDHMI